MLDGKRIPPRLGKKRQGHARSAIREGGRPIIRCANLDAPDIAQARDAPQGVRFQEDCPELFRGGQPAKRLYVELVGLSRGDRWLVEDTRRDLNILCPQSSEDFTGAQIV